MSLNNVGDIITEVLVRNNRTTLESFVTDTMLQDWTRMAHKWAASAHKFPFTEGRISTTFTTTAGGPNGDEWYFEGFKADAVEMAQIDGKELRKLDFRSYQKFRESQTDGDERVFSDYGRTVYVNPGVDLSGTLTVWGQFEPTLDPTDLTATTVFSGYDEEANEAIVEKMTSYLKEREHDYKESEFRSQKAQAILDNVWKRVLDSQYLYQQHNDTGGMFERINVLEGGFHNDIVKRDQW